MDYDDITPARVIRENYRWLPAVLIVLSTIVGIFALLQFVLWPLHWWYYQNGVNRQAQITQQSYENQLTMSQQVQSKIADVYAITTQITAAPADAGPLIAQRASVAGIACADWAQLTATFRTSSGEAAWAAANCQGGVLSPSSAYFPKGGNQ